MSLYGLFAGVGESGFGANSTSDDVTDGLDLSGKTYLLTGCNSGIGADTLRVLDARGARVLAAARTIEKAQAACSRARHAVPVACELSEPTSVREAVATVQGQDALDGIVCNAGVMALPEAVRHYGYELQFFTNHVGHFLLVTALLDRLKPAGRVVMVSSSAHNRAYPEGIRVDDLAAERGYSPWGAYGQSKLANMLFARHLSGRLPHPDQTANSIHPGVIATNLTRHMNPVLSGLFAGVGPLIFAKSVAQGAATQCYAVAHPDAARFNGEFLADCNLATSSPHGRDDRLAAALWQRTEEIVAGLPK